MSRQLEEFILSRVKSPSSQEIQEILRIFVKKSYKKGDLFKEPNTRITDLGFVISGSARAFVVNKNGDEVTGQVLQEHTFLSEIISVRTGEKTPISIEFLERSEVEVAPLSEVKRLLESNLVFNILIREYMADKTVEVAKRQILFMTGTAKERYQQLIENNPNLLKKFPLRFIASMIGVTPTQLSRIRKPRSENV